MLIALNATRLHLKSECRALEERLSDVEARGERLSRIAEEAGAAQSLKARDLSAFKDDLSKLTQSRRSLYEGGLQLQEEKRLLEKQWEIVSVYLMIDEEAKKIHLMRGEQSLESYPISYAPSHGFGAGLSPTPPPFLQIVSKERFAHPERGKSEQVAGQLQWEPPQVGTSVRSNALGEYVMFTRGALILHGPPRKTEEHGLFPHYCVGLGLGAARKLYLNSFIGTKIWIKPAPRPAAPAAPAKEKKK
ncbi:MAG: hypothetical protein HY921_01410 [Elusimicrobia bacterium]|nr:hypothetical protein [Elusimicrobiota bacterium]